MPTIAQTVETLLNTAPLRDQLTPLFCKVLNWGAPTENPRALSIGVPVSKTITVVPVAQLSHLPVFRIDWDADRLPNVTERRAIQKALAPTALQHLLCYVSRDGKQAAFVWARPRGSGSASRMELRTLPYDAGSSARTTIERLEALHFSIADLGLLGEPALDVVQGKLNAAFNVEAVTREFFQQYSAIFKQVEAALPPALQGEERRMFTQRLFNRLMFIAFIQKKGWLHIAGQKDKNYLEALWQLYQADEHKETNFYNGRLRALFFSGLNNANEVDVTAALADYIGKVPYLNGGLFEENEADRNPAITVPDECFDAMLHKLFGCYNFTVTESTPLDIEVAVDPEMLGKVFEELVTGRHESGSYYTPKSIVSFMCREALKTYLGNALPKEAAAAIAGFVDEHNAAALRNPEAMLAALRAVRVCDPACGSGAYLLGMMHELLDLRAALFNTKQLDAPTIYERKLEIIQSNLYGVDKDLFAVGIARLRLWLSLAIDSNEPTPLPNLDFKIEAGDSLSAPDPSRAPQADLFRQQLIDEFLQDKATYLTTHGAGAKRALLEKIKAQKAKITALVYKEKSKTKGDKGAPDAPQQGFDWAVEFAEVFAPQHPIATIGGAFNFGQELAEQPEPGGFDIVLANPPYVRGGLITEMKPMLKSVYPEVYHGDADLYVYFYARALQLLKVNGVLSFISSNKWFRTKYGTNLRKHIAEAIKVLSITDFGDLPVFQSATAYAMIFIAHKQQSKSSPILTQVKSLDYPYPDVLSIINEQGCSLSPSALDGANWILSDTSQANRLGTILNAGISLSKYVNDRVYRGVTTGLNEAFIIDRPKRDELIRQDAKSSEIIRPLLTGRDIKKWCVDQQERWLIFTRRGIDIDAYPAIKRHLTQWRKQLEPRPRIWPTNEAWEGRKPGNYKWFEIQDEVAYYTGFTKPKIISTKVSIRPTFALDIDEHYLGNTAYFLPVQEEANYLLGLLNSSVFYEYAKEVFVEKQNGWYEVQPKGLEAFPIPNAPTAERNKIVALVQKCLDAKGIGCEAWEREINERVAALYGLDAPPSNGEAATVAAPVAAREAPDRAPRRAATVTRRAAPMPVPQPAAPVESKKIVTLAYSDAYREFSEYLDTLCENYGITSEDPAVAALPIPHLPISAYTRDDLIAALLAGLEGLEGEWIQRDEAVRLAARQFGMARVGKNIRAAFKGAVTSAIRRGLIEYDGIWVRVA